MAKKDEKEKFYLLALVGLVGLIAIILMVSGNGKNSSGSAIGYGNMCTIEKVQQNGLYCEIPVCFDEQGMPSIAGEKRCYDLYGNPINMGFRR